MVGAVFETVGFAKERYHFLVIYRKYCDILSLKGGESHGLIYIKRGS